MKKTLQKITKIALLLFVFIILSYSCKKDSTTTTPSTTTVTDIDGNIYHTVTIGSQVWMVENLKVIHYRNGDPIPNITDSIAWSNLNSGAYSNYKNDVNMGNIYGKLYNFYTIADPRLLCPIGWHVPTNAEWTTLTDYLGGEGIAGGKLKETGLAHWTSPNTAATNETGFTALPAGCHGISGTYASIGIYGFWWSSTEIDSDYAWYRAIHYSSSQAGRYDNDRGSGMSVRCLRD